MSNNNPWAQVLSGNSLNDYILDSSGPLGSGAFGLVFRANKGEGGSPCAVKVLDPRAEIDHQADFANEGELLKKLAGSKNVAQLADGSGTAHIEMEMNGVKIPIPVRYHVMELASDSLDHHLMSRSTDWVEKLTLWRDIVAGIHQMHNRRVAHRDLKAENCLVFNKPKRKVDCKVSDLGRSRDLTDQSRHRPEFYLQGLGDLRWAPPEFLMIQGVDNERAHRDADLYGLGSMMFEIVSGTGLTSQVFPNIHAVRNEALNDWHAGRCIQLDALRSLYDSAFAGFEESIPKVIRERISKLVRTLCDPVPAVRRKAEGPQRRGKPYSLESILLQIDISIRQLSVDKKSGAAPQKKRRV